MGRIRPFAGLRCPAMAQGVKPVGAVGSSNWLRICTAVGLALVAAVAVWLVVKGDDDAGESSAGASTANAATVSTLRALPGELGHDVYWAGPRNPNKRELTQVNDSIFIRYLPYGIHVGDPRPDYLTVGTYPRARAYGLLQQMSRERRSRSRRASGGGIAVWSENRPQSVYLAFPRSNVQIEVYDPSAARARRLATTGAVRPIR
jgi:hypothetical protein